MKVTYIALGGTTFEGPLFSPAMEIVTLPGGRVFQSEIVRREIEVGEGGRFIYPEENT